MLILTQSCSNCNCFNLFLLLKIEKNRLFRLFHFRGLENVKQKEEIKQLSVNTVVSMIILFLFYNFINFNSYLPLRNWTAIPLRRCSSNRRRGRRGPCIARTPSTHRCAAQLSGDNYPIETNCHTAADRPQF